MSRLARSLLSLPLLPARLLYGLGAQGLELQRILLGAADAAVGPTAKDEIWRKNKARLYRYRRSTAATRKTPIFLCMPLINRAYILDLRPGASLVEYLLGEGHDIFLLDWGEPGDEDGRLDLEDHIVRYLSRAIARASRLAGQPLTLLGYCIGGVLASCYLALYPTAPIKNLILFTTPIDFAEAGRFGKWTKKESYPLDQLTSIFPTVPTTIPEFGSKLLTPLPSAIGVYLQLWDKLSQEGFDAAAWQSMYRWINDGVPFPSAAFRRWIADFYQDNRLIAGTLRMAGQTVQLRSIRCPLLNVVASSDDIAPRPTTAAILHAVSSSDKQELVVEGGHVGIVIGRAAKRDLWPKLASWLQAHD